MDAFLLAQINLLLDHYGIESLERAVDRITSTYRGEMRVIHTRATDTRPIITFTLTNAEFDRVMAHVNDNQKITAIKEFRSITNCGLVEAKNAIEGPEFGMLRFNDRFEK